MFPPKLVTGLISFYWSELLYNTVLVSDVQQSESALRLPTSPLFWMSFRFRSLHRIEYRSLCNTVGSHYLIIYFIPAFFFQLLSHVRLFTTPWTSAYQASLSFTISWSLLKLRSIELVMPSNHLVLCHPLLFLPSIFPHNQSLFKWVSSLHQGAKVLEFQLQHQFFQSTPRTDLL